MSTPALKTCFNQQIQFNVTSILCLKNILLNMFQFLYVIKVKAKQLVY